MQLTRRERQATPLARWPQDMLDWFDGLLSAPLAPFMGMGTGLVPAVDIEETEENIVVKVELPGVDPKDVEVSLRNDVLTIRGEKRQESEQKEGNYHRTERRYGSFTREIRLPMGFDASKIEAKAHNGVLRVCLPKSEKSKPTRIEVKTE